MNRAIPFLTALSVLLCACGDGDQPPRTTLPGEPALEGQAAAQRLLPEHPKAFRIELWGGSCLGSCPTYSMSLDQDGYVSFVGEGCLLRPGVWERSVARADARAVYDALLATPFDSLGDRYETEADGCTLITDAPTTVWKVVADGKKKNLKHYGGCLGVDEEKLKEVEAIRSFMQERAQVLDVLETDKGCPFQFNRIPAATFRMSRAGTALGMVQVTAMYEAPRYFELRDCAGAVLAKGDARIQGGRLILLEENRGTITLPGELGSAASLLLELATPPGSSREPLVPTQARALRDDEDLVFDLVVASSCEG
jgi:Domain of unknown function (DUF6438)